ncbi:hypothetical protein COCCADRAFT_83992, partial [Bipolaris zeicola 26-R-13]
GSTISCLLWYTLGQCLLDMMEMMRFSTYDLGQRKYPERISPLGYLERDLDCATKISSLFWFSHKWSHTCLFKKLMQFCCDVEKIVDV